MVKGFVAEERIKMFLKPSDFERLNFDFNPSQLLLAAISSK